MPDDKKTDWEKKIIDLWKNSCYTGKLVLNFHKGTVGSVEEARRHTNDALDR